MPSEEVRTRNIYTIIALNIGSLILIAGAIYILKELAILYGIGIGAAIESLSYNVPLSQLVSSTATQITSYRTGILESYIILLVALGTVGVAFTLYLKRFEKGDNAISAYSLLHSGLVVFYILMIYLILSDFYTSFNQIYLYIVYFGMGLCIMSDLYLQYEIRQPKAESKIPRTISIDPSKPFSNVIALQDQLFPNMNGHLKIVDKHFNSAALQNFHRIAEKSMQNFTKVTILTSKEMLDSGFGQYVSDLRSELSGAGVGLEIKLMDDKDTVDQHERIMLDDKIAYKIPPFNIINKRSEHITRISHEEANKRFQYLFNRSIKLENYSVKRARDGEEK